MRQRLLSCLYSEQNHNGPFFSCETRMLRPKIGLRGIKSESTLLSSWCDPTSSWCGLTTPQLLIEKISFLISKIFQPSENISEQLNVSEFIGASRTTFPFESSSHFVPRSSRRWPKVLTISKYYGPCTIWVMHSADNISTSYWHYSKRDKLLGSAISLGTFALPCVWWERNESVIYARNDEYYYASSQLLKDLRLGMI